MAFNYNPGRSKKEIGILSIQSTSCRQGRIRHSHVAILQYFTTHVYNPLFDFWLVYTVCSYILTLVILTGINVFKLAFKWKMLCCFCKMWILWLVYVFSGDFIVSYFIANVCLFWLTQVIMLTVIFNIKINATLYCKYWVIEMRLQCTCI